MIIRGKSKRTVFLLGAGATRGAVPHVLVRGKRVRPPLNSDFFDVAETLARARGEGSATARRLLRIKKIFKTELPAKWPPPMETAFSLLYTAKDFPEIYASGPGRKPTAGERRELNDFLTLLFDILFVLDKQSPDANGYDRLASVLESNDTLITLNYDTVLDSALVRRGWDPKTGYGLFGGPKKVKWKAPAVSSSEMQSIRLLKLHGSLNWWVRGNASTLGNAFSSKPVFVSPPRSNDVAGMIRQIIPPIYGKVFGHPHWRRIWKAAFTALCEADQLVVVGCSIVDTDYHLQALLRRAVKERRKTSRRLDVSLVDRARIRRRWQHVLKGAQANYETYSNLEIFLKRGIKV